jgi:hypothetical protein
VARIFMTQKTAVIAGTRIAKFNLFTGECFPGELKLC